MASQVLQQLPIPSDSNVLHISKQDFSLNEDYLYVTISQVRMQIFQPVLELPLHSLFLCGKEFL